VLARGEAKQLKVEVLHITNKVEGVCKVALLLFALLFEQSHEAHIPHKELLFLLLVEVGVGLNKGVVDSLGREPKRTKEVFELPEVEDIFGDVLAPFLLCYIHMEGLCFL
jgi:hypothetical protein